LGETEKLQSFSSVFVKCGRFDNGLIC